jgi:hypothetical protein
MKNVCMRNFIKLYIKQHKYSGSRPFMHTPTYWHFMAHSENKWFKSIYGEEKVTAASCPSEGE